MSDDDFHRDAATLSHIASKMPTPPPRPPSIASSTRSSSKRSSGASSPFRQSRHTSLALELEASEAPPTPKFSSRYTSANTLGEELSHFAELIPSSSIASLERSTSAASSPRLSRTRSASSGYFSTAKKRSTQTLKERDRESSIMTTNTARSPPASPQLLFRNSKAQTVQNQMAMSPQHSQEALVESIQEKTEIQSDPQRFLSACECFILDVLSAYSVIWSIVVWPLMLAMIDSAADMMHNSSSLDINKTPSTSSSTDISAQTKELERTFAERFKYLVCTSLLLTKSLSISNYDQVTSPINSKGVTLSSNLANNPSPLSKIAPDEVSACSSESRRSTLHLNDTGKLLSNATCIAIVLLGPLTRSQQGWFQSAVFLVSLVLGTIATFGLDRGMEVTFEVSHKPSGTYSLSEYDARIKREGQGEYISATKANNTKESLCTQVTGLIKSCKGFDVECNKVIAAVQEVELVSRGFKLSHPLPPISRIEANAKHTSPPRVRNGSWQSPASVLNTARLSRSSSSGASAASGSKHHGQRPQSIFFSQDNTSPNSGRGSPQDVEAESFRLASLRKGLVVSFEDARKALETAIEGLEPLIDKSEMKLLEEMYELDSSLEDGQLASVLPTTSFGRGMAEKRSSWIHTARLRLEDEQPSSPTMEESDRPSTPQRFNPLYDGMIASQSARKRDSGISETWSVASPSREVYPIRTGSRLGYVSDKTAISGTPNQNAESKRLSYVSASPNVSSPVQSKTFSLQQASPALSSQSMNRKRASLLGSGILDDLKQTNSMVLHSNTPSKTDIFLIASLKSSFDKVHSLRRKVFCQLLALEFNFKKRFSEKKCASLSTLAYWAAVSQVMKQLSSTMSRLALESTQSLEKEISIGGGEDSSLIKQGGVSHKDSLATIQNSDSLPHQDFTGIEDRLTAMGQALRSIQVKMIVCAQELKVKNPPTLHGAPSLLEDSNSPLRNEKPEKVLETIREDLLMLSAEWESALKILRSQRSSTPGSAIGDTTASTLNSSRLDSPQEAEEDALRQWVQARRGADESSDSEDERVASRMIESGMLQWSGLNNQDGRWQDHNELSDLLVKTASPEHLSPPGLEKIYESMGNAFEAKKQKSGLSREERIQLAKEGRVTAAAAKENVGKLDSIGLEASSGMIQELQAVMKNRKSINGNDAAREFKGIDTSNTPNEGGTFKYDTSR